MRGAAGLGFLQVVPNYGGAALHKFLFRFVERLGEVALDVELSREFAFREDGDDDFTLHHGRSRKIARIGGDIVHDYDLPAAGRGTAESAVERNAGVG